MIHPSTPASLLASERYQSFRIGFVDGVKAVVKAARFEGHRLGPDYDRGYQAGRRAKNSAVAAYAKEVGHDPTYDMLRAGTSDALQGLLLFPSHEWDEPKPSRSMTERKIRRCKVCHMAYRRKLVGQPCRGLL